MTTKTETLYRINMSPECIEIGLKHGTYEKVSHVLPNDDHKQVAIELNEECGKHRQLISDILNALGETDESQIDIVKEIRALRDDSRKASDLTLKIGDMIHERIELQKKVEECETIIDGQDKNIESQNREIESLKKRNTYQGCYEHLRSEIARLKSENEAFFVQLGQEREANNRLHLELEDAKKGVVVWEEIGTPFNKNDNRAVIGCLFEGEKDVIRVNCKGFSVAIPLPPQPRTIDEEVNEAFATSVTHGFSSRSDRDGFIAGFKAAKEPKGEK